MKQNVMPIARRTLLAGAILALTLLCSAALSKTTAYAADDAWPEIKTDTECRIIDTKEGYDSIMSYSLDPEYIDLSSDVQWKVSNVKISKKIAKITYDGELVTVVPKKAGKAKVTFKLTNTETGESKTYTLLKLTYVKYVNPFKSIKVGKSEQKSYYNSAGSMGLIKKKSAKQKLSIKLIKGYKITSITYNGKKLKNGKKYKFDEGGTDIVITVMHKKTKATREMYLYVK